MVLRIVLDAVYTAMAVGQLASFGHMPGVLAAYIPGTLRPARHVSTVGAGLLIVLPCVGPLLLAGLVAVTVGSARGSPLLITWVS